MSRRRMIHDGRFNPFAEPSLSVGELLAMSNSAMVSFVLSVASRPAEHAVRRLGLSAADADEIALEVAERAAGFGATGVVAANPAAPILAWVRAATWRVALERLRDRNRSDPREAERRELESRMRRRTARHARWDGLVERFGGRLLRTQRALLMAYLEGLSDDSLALRTGLRRATVTERLRRIRHRLKGLASGVDDSDMAAVPQVDDPRLPSHDPSLAVLLRLRATRATYRDIAQAVGRTAAAVRSSLQRARRIVGATNTGDPPPLRPTS